MASSYCCSRLLLQSQSWRLMLRFSPFLATSPPSSSLSFSSNCHVSSSAQLTTLQQQQQPLPRSSQLVALEYADLNLSHNLVTFLYSYDSFVLSANAISFVNGKFEITTFLSPFSLQSPNQPYKSQRN